MLRNSRSKTGSAGASKLTPQPWPPPRVLKTNLHHAPLSATVVVRFRLSHAVRNIMEPVSPEPHAEKRISGNLEAVLPIQNPTLHYGPSSNRGKVRRARPDRRRTCASTGTGTAKQSAKGGSLGRQLSVTACHAATRRARPGEAWGVGISPSVPHGARACARAERDLET